MKIFAAHPDYTFRNNQKEEEHEFRDKFSRDRDRILYSTEFRRLAYKTQVFVAGFDDNNRNRLTHTLEVAQIATTISKYFNLNKELTEAIALGHDVGHTPFGHTGERTLNLILNGCEELSEIYKNQDDVKGFKHNWQSIRVVTTLEKNNDLYDGLNLTDFTIWGLLHHTNRFYCCEDDIIENFPDDVKTNVCDYFFTNNQCQRPLKTEDCLNNGKHHLNFYTSLEKYFQNSSWTLEALIVRIADEIAQRHHDIEDAINAKIVGNKELAELFHDSLNPFLAPTEKSKLTNLGKEENNHLFIKTLTNFIINFYVNNLIENTKKNLIKLKRRFDLEDNIVFHKNKSKIFDSLHLKGILNLVSFESNIKEADKSIKDYLKQRILYSHLAQTMDGKATYIIKRLIDAFLTNPAQLPDKTITTFFKNYWPKGKFEDEYEKRKGPAIAGYFRNELKNLVKNTAQKDYVLILHRTIGDFIAGMTDSFALRQYERLYGSLELKNY